MPRKSQTMSLIEKLTNERRELDKKIAKLVGWLNRDPVHGVSAEMRKLMVEQKNAMMEYDRALLTRIELLQSTIR